MVLFIVVMGIYFIKCAVVPLSVFDVVTSCHTVVPLSYYTLVGMGCLELLMEIKGVIRIYLKKK